MNKVRLDAAEWTSIGDFYDALLPALNAPIWHSHSINAMIDSIIGGGMNGVEPPFVICISGTSCLDRTVLDHLKTAQYYLAKARRENRESFDHDVDATIEIVG